MKKIILFTTLAISSFNFSCKKGDTGPAGKDGTNGNANISTSTFQVNTSAWVNGSNYWYVDIPVSALTSSNHGAAAVEVFFSTNSGVNWHAVPYTAVSSTDYFMGFATGVGLTEIQWTYNGVGNGSDPNTFFGATCQFKIVVIPPAMKKPGVNTHSYNELKAAYNLKD
ncbi:MAG TPA: hypothetical protein VN026_03850 [Bacteroidia bacterium]|jgi:hypothetical protein|nr:hypothetical protein [Bacteroidia bacterium]